MSPPSSTTVVTNLKRSARSRSSTPKGSISLLSPTSSSTEVKPVSRGPCPALNTLANHGYLPLDGNNISAEDLLKALQNPETYNLSALLAKVLVYGGLHMVQKAPPLSLHDFAQHGRIEHDASIVHKNAALRCLYVPMRCDTHLLEELLEEKEFLTLEHVAKWQAKLEKVSKIDAVHAEIARGEWALVLDVFGRAHGGRVPCDLLRVWLKENRFPEGWRPTHEQGLFKTFLKSQELHVKMLEYEKVIESQGYDADEVVLAAELRTTMEEEQEETGTGKGRALDSSTLTPRPAKRQKTFQEDMH